MKLKTNKLIELLLLVDGIRTSSWATMTELILAFNENTASNIKKEWGDKFKKENPQYYPLDLTVMKTWSTFDNHECIDIRFFYVNDSLQCVAKLYDGESLNGHRKALRFTVECSLPDSFIQNITEQIEWAMDGFIEQSYIDHLEAEKQMWKHNFKKELLGKS